MKKRVWRIWLLGSFGAGLLAPLALSAQTAGAPNEAGSTISETTPARLPYGVEDVLKLTRAQISEDITLNYIQNSGTIYNLGPQDIVYLRNQGVSGRVINAMLDQRKKAAAVPAQNSSPGGNVPSVPTAPAVPNAPTVAAATTYVQPAPVYVQPPVPEIQAAPSTVHVIPYPPTTYAYYGYYSRPYPYNYYGGYCPPYGYYRGYYGYGGPSIALGFRFGGGHHQHHFRHWR